MTGLWGGGGGATQISAIKSNRGVEIVLPNFPLIVLLPRQAEGEASLGGSGLDGVGILFPFKLPAVLPISEGGRISFCFDMQMVLKFRASLEMKLPKSFCLANLPRQATN